MNQFLTLLLLMILSFHHLIPTTFKPITDIQQPLRSQQPVKYLQTKPVAFLFPPAQAINMYFYSTTTTLITSTPLPSKAEIYIYTLAAYKTAHALLVRSGLLPRLQRLDNECSDILKDFMHEQQVDFQLVPPHMHRRNYSERTIRTFKNHFISGLCSTDKNSPPPPLGPTPSSGLIDSL